ncbi:MAG: PIN domain-containing protein [Gammaproteobacteria bacterium]
MTGRVFLDTNVVIYTIDKAGPKRERARVLLGNDPIVSVQVINEAVNVCLKKLSKTREEAYRFGERIMSCCDTASIDRLDVETAFRISMQYSLSHWDSLIIAVAIRQGCEAVYSEDMQHNLQVAPGTRVINPFIP